MNTDTPQQARTVRTNKAAKKVRKAFPVGTVVTASHPSNTTNEPLGTVVRHVPHSNAQGGYLVVEWANGNTGRHSAISLRTIEKTDLEEIQMNQPTERLATAPLTTANPGTRPISTTDVTDADVTGVKRGLLNLHKGEEHVWCPYPDCGFEGTEDEVNEHRTVEVGPGGVHRDDEQAGSNLRHKPL